MQKFLSRLLLVILLLPAPAYAGAMLRVEDAVAGLEALVDMSGFSGNTSVELHVVSPSGDDSAVPVHTGASGNASIALPSSLTEEAGSYQAFTRGASDVRTTFTVLPGRVDADLSTVDASALTLRADGNDEVTVTATLVDAFHNPLAGRPVEIVSSRSSDTITPLTRETDGQGEEHFSLKTTEPGNVTLRAMDFLSGMMLNQDLQLSAGSTGGVGGSTAPRSPLAADVSTDFSALDHFEVTLEPAAPKVNEVLTMTIRAVDQNGRTVEDYAGTVEVHAPNDPGASLPGFGNGHGSVQFSPKNLGKKVVGLSISFSRAGEQELTVIDASDPQNIVQGSVTVSVEESNGPSDPSKRIEILSHRDGGLVGGTDILLEGIGPAYSNLEVTGSLSTVTGETDAQGHFSIPVRLNSAENTFTLRVQDETHRYDSGPLHLLRDNQSPTVQFQFDPKEPAQDSDALLTVQSEPGLRSLVMTLVNQQLTLTEQTNQPGTYNVLFRAPPTGKYDVKVTATDQAGNIGEATGILNVLQRELPTVRNLHAEPGFSGVTLSWEKPLSEEPTSYIVYIGTGAGVYGSSLDTGGPRTTVSVMGLKANQQYFFAVAMAEDDRRGPQSDPVTGTPLGLSLDATPGDGLLTLNWTYPDERVSSFIVEYGISPDKRTEKRTINGALRTYNLRDLLNGVTYYLHVTPVSVTGEVQSQMAADAVGTPSGDAGFHPSGEDPIPFKPGTIPELHGSAPSTPSSGLPAFTMIGLIGASVVAFVFIRRRKLALQMTNDFLRTMQNRYRQ